MTTVEERIDKRTQQFLDELRKKVGLIKVVAGYDELVKGEPDKKLEIWVNATGSGYTDIQKMKNGNWVAQTGFRTDIDDYVIINYIFDHEPSEQDIRTIALIEEIEFALFRYPELANVKCYNCGTETHWLDIKMDSELNLRDKWEAAKNGWCGSCGGENDRV